MANKIVFFIAAVGFIIIPIRIIVAILSRKKDYLSLFQNLIGFNIQKLISDPKFIEKIITTNPVHRPKIIKALSQIKSIKKIKPLNANTIDLLTKSQDKSEHWYRAKITIENKEKKLSELNKYS